MPAYGVPTLVPVRGISVGGPPFCTVTALPWMEPVICAGLAAAQADCSPSRFAIACSVNCTNGALELKYSLYW